MAGEGNWYDLRVYVGNIGRYNEGSLVGGWATLPMGRDDLDAFLRDRVGIDGESALKISSAVGCVQCVIRYSIMARRCKEGFTPKPDRY